MPTEESFHEIYVVAADGGADDPQGQGRVWFKRLDRLRKAFGGLEPTQRESERKKERIAC